MNLRSFLTWSLSILAVLPVIGVVHWISIHAAGTALGLVLLASGLFGIARSRSSGDAWTGVSIICSGAMALAFTWQDILPAWLVVAIVLPAVAGFVGYLRRRHTAGRTAARASQSDPSAVALRSGQVLRPAAGSRPQTPSRVSRPWGSGPLKPSDWPRRMPPTGTARSYAHAFPHSSGRGWRRKELTR